MGDGSWVLPKKKKRSAGSKGRKGRFLKVRKLIAKSSFFLVPLHRVTYNDGSDGHKCHQTQSLVVYGPSVRRGLLFFDEQREREESEREGRTTAKLRLTVPMDEEELHWFPWTEWVREREEKKKQKETTLWRKNSLYIFTDWISICHLIDLWKGL